MYWEKTIFGTSTFYEFMRYEITVVEGKEWLIGNLKTVQWIAKHRRKELRCLLFQMKNCQVMVAQNGSYAEEVGAEGSRVRGQPGLSFRAGKMAKLLRCAVFPEDRNSVPSNHVRRLVTTCPSISKASTPSFVLHIHIEDSCTGTYMYHN